MRKMRREKKAKVIAINTLLPSLKEREERLKKDFAPKILFPTTQS
jgi:hypothetical protein